MLLIYSLISYINYMILALIYLTSRTWTRDARVKSRFFTVHRVYNRICKNSADVVGYRRDQAKVRRRKDAGKFEDVGSKGEISRNTIW